MSYHGRLTFFNFEKGYPFKSCSMRHNTITAPPPQLSRIQNPFSAPSTRFAIVFQIFVYFFSPYKRPNCCGKPLYFALKKQSPALLFIYLDLCVYVYGAIFGTYVDGSLMTDGSQQPLGLEAFWMRTL